MIIKLKTEFMGHKAGSEIEVSHKLGKRLVADGDAVEVVKTGAKPTRTKVATADNVKG
jgi:hypothetical protein